jgi:hypothetical protein
MRTVISTLVGLLMLFHQAGAAIPLQVNYQGKVLVNAAPFNGTGLFRFTLANRDTSVTLWCNDGSRVGQSANSIPTAAVSLPVANGIGSVRLGDTALANMTALPSTAFDSDRVVLRVWFDDQVNGNRRLSPDEPLTAIGYAFHALKADNATTAAYALNSINWIHVTGTSQQAAANGGYVANNASMVTITLPPSTSLSVGDVIRVSGVGAGGWKIAQNAGQKMRLRNLEIPDYSATWTPRESSRNWNCVASSADGTKLVACVWGGQIYMSSDSGTSWTTRASNRQWRSVASSADGIKLVACVWDGQIYTSWDSGLTWTPRESNRKWAGVASSADGTKLVACDNGGGSGQIYTSSDSGTSWTARASNRGWYGVASSADGTKLIACDRGGQIYTSSDSGVIWTPRESNRFWAFVASSADGTKLVACGDTGARIYTSSDSGVTWTGRESNRTWRSVASSADGTKLVACAWGGQIYTSSDCGVTWTARESARSWFALASSADGAKLVACVSGGQIYTYDTWAGTLVETTAGPAGSLSGGKDSAVELQYIGADTFLAIGHEGPLDAR